MPETLTETLQCLHHSDEGVSVEDKYGYGSSSVSEIIEEDNSSHLHLNHAPMLSIHEHEEEQDIVYVAVGKGQSSVEALSWTLNNLPSPSTFLYLIHVFPEIKHVPNPLGVGMIPKDQVSPEQVENYMAQERGKRRELLYKFLQSCTASKVKVDTILIESDLIAKAIIDLIPILQIRKLVVGANKSQLRKLRSRKGNGIADQILQNVPESCNVSIVCEGKEVNEQITRAIDNDTSISQKHLQDASVSCILCSSTTEKEQTLEQNMIYFADLHSRRRHYTKTEQVHKYPSAEDFPWILADNLLS
ncbi:hypothetical protein VNO77_25381 [Canavalia gladiata]|uniref:Uncharacterized protein n=1 Tax=Canavalia gladiata TaxID=3824 RepID=A0AAN9LBE3_CANGL